MLRNLLTPWGEVITKLAFVPQKSLVARYMKIFMAFFLSGLLHLNSDRAIGISAEKSGAVWFFLMQAVAITTEDFFQELCRRASITRRWPGLCYLGYVWVTSILFLTTPRWIYPAIVADPTPMILLPLGIVDRVQSILSM
jgi:hypothetical protein